MNTIKISTRVTKMFNFSLVLRIRENTDGFLHSMKICMVFTAREQMSSISVIKEWLRSIPHISVLTLCQVFLVFITIIIIIIIIVAAAYHLLTDDVCGEGTTELQGISRKFFRQ